MGLFKRKTVSVAKNGGAYYDKQGRFVDPGADTSVSCQRCGTGYRDGRSHCDCGVDLRLYGIS